MVYMGTAAIAERGRRFRSSMIYLVMNALWGGLKPLFQMQHYHKMQAI